MSSALFWIDFVTDPMNILLSGLTIGILTLFFTAGIMWVFNVSRKTGRWIVITVAVLAIVATQAACWGLVIWYNTPLGPPLDLVR